MAPGFVTPKWRYTYAHPMKAYGAGRHNLHNSMHLKDMTKTHKQGKPPTG